MSDFIEIPVNNLSTAMKRPLFGVGINDAEYMVVSTENKKISTCPYYKKWCDMLRRCYYKKHQGKSLAYKDCSVCTDWLLFSNFKAWMIKQDWKEKHLDKDILIQGNKIYSPEACLFVTREINNLLSDAGVRKGKYPTGVSFRKGYGNYQARCSSSGTSGKSNSLGCFSSPEEASSVYKIFKYKVIAIAAEKQSEPLKSALLRFRITS